MTDLQTLLRELRKRHTAAENDLREMMDDLIFLERIIEIEDENEQLRFGKKRLIELNKQLDEQRQQADRIGQRKWDECNKFEIENKLLQAETETIKDTIQMFVKANDRLQKEKQDLIESIKYAIGGIDAFFRNNKDAEAVRKTLENAILEKE